MRARGFVENLRIASAKNVRAGDVLGAHSNYRDETGSTPLRPQKFSLFFLFRFFGITAELPVSQYPSRIRNENGWLAGPPPSLSSKCEYQSLLYPRSLFTLPVA